MIHSELDVGGMMPDIGCHSTMDSPDLVSLVMPPINTMMSMSTQAEMSQVVICFCVFLSIFKDCSEIKLPMKSLWSGQSIYLDYVNVSIPYKIIHNHVLRCFWL